MAEGVVHEELCVRDAGLVGGRVLQGGLWGGFGCHTSGL